MEKEKVGVSLIKRFVDPDFQDENFINLWKKCCNNMLWEGIGIEGSVISEREVITYLRETKNVYVFPEPLPAFYLGCEVECKRMSTQELISSSSDWPHNYPVRGVTCFEIEPLYIINSDYSWMIVLTTENTPNGGQMCLLVSEKKK